MNRYHINWSRLVDSDLVRDIATLAGLDGPNSIEDARPLVARILRATGGWPYVATIPSRKEVRAHTRRLLGEAFAHTLGGTAATAPGYRLNAATGRLPMIETVPRVEINVGSVADLLTLPEMTPKRAGAIATERERGGPYRNVIDLCERQPWLGKAYANRLISLSSFRRQPLPAARSTGDWRRDLLTLISQESPADARSRLFAALERVAQIVTLHRHPHLRHHLARRFPLAGAPTSRAEAELIVLGGRRYYYYVRDQIRLAERSIHILMFHIALPGRDHPTRQLLEALVAAKKRGVRVRVLVDRDRRNDPYRSQVINAAAAQYLLQEKIPVRADRPDRLLHSKMIIIDGNQTIIGSHNWSAGSFFMFDDLSVAVVSSKFGINSRRRFRALWRRGEPIRAGRGTTR